MIKSVTVIWTDSTRKNFVCSDVVIENGSFFLYNSRREVIEILPSRTVKYISVHRGS